MRFRKKEAEMCFFVSEKCFLERFVAKNGFDPSRYKTPNFPLITNLLDPIPPWELQEGKNYGSQFVESLFAVLGKQKL